MTAHVQNLRVVQWQLIQLCLSCCRSVVALVTKEIQNGGANYVIQQGVSHTIVQILKAMTMPI